jgi:methionyl-tRNA formyltransferase
MRDGVVFFGSDGIALPLLEFLADGGTLPLVGIVTGPDRPAGRGQTMAKTAVASFAERRGIPTIKPEALDGGTVAWLGEIGCAMILVMAYGRMLRRNILDFPPLGIYNFHASILPKYRGASPIEAAIASGERETGVSLMEIVEEMDAGAVAAVGTVPIVDGDNHGTVANKIAAACPILLGKNFEALRAGTVHWHPQDRARASYTRKLSKEDGAIDFSLPAEALKNRLRALTPHIGGRLDSGGVSLKIGAVSAEAESSGRTRCGEIISVGRDGLRVATGRGTLVIHELQRPGGRMLPVGDFTNGFPLRRGTVIPSHGTVDLVFPHPFTGKIR